jgi:L-alanine-DL-glutamate epimerase-like enolase superfamily enzyme
VRIADIRVHELQVAFPAPWVATWGHGEPERVHGHCVVEVLTDEGITGYGAAEAMWGWGEVHRAVSERMLKPRLLGGDVFATEEIIQHCRDVPGRAWMVENAVWDIVGKAAGLPVYRLWGGFQQRVRAYASWGRVRSAAQACDDAHAVLEAGFTALKLRFHQADLAADLALAEAVRKSVGDRLVLMVDANQATAPYRGGARDVSRLWSYERALATARALQDLGVLWLEEPLPMHAYRDLTRLAAASDIAIAGGEINRGIHEFKRFLDEECYDIVQPNVTMAEGMFQVRKIAAYAELHGRLCCPHAWVQGPGWYANLQVAAACRNSPWIEFPFDPPHVVPDNFHAVLTERPSLDREGFVAVPQRPGLGCEIDPDALRRWKKN